MAHVKGSAVTSRIRYIREHFGEAAFRRLREALPEDSRLTVDGRVLPHSWVPYSVFIDINVEADRLFGKGDLQLCYEMGRYGAEVNLPTLYRLFYRLGTPHYIFSKATRIWDVHYDSGRLVLGDSTPTSMTIRIEDFDQPHRAHCLSIHGWAMRSLEMSGCTILRHAEDKCRTRGDAVCEISAQWR